VKEFCGLFCGGVSVQTKDRQADRPLLFFVRVCGLFLVVFKDSSHVLDMMAIYRLCRAFFFLFFL